MALPVPGTTTGWGAQLNAYLSALHVSSTASSILARMNQADSFKIALTSQSPTFTASTTSTISGGILMAPRRVTPANLSWATYTAVDYANDPHFRYLSPPTYGTVFPDYNYVRTPLLTGGSSQAAYFPLGVAFYYDGANFEVSAKPYTTSIPMRLRIDGQLVSLAMPTVVTGLSAGTGYYVKVALGSQAMRLIEIEIDGADPAFGGIMIEPTATISRAPEPSIRVATLTDSIGAGATDYSRYSSWVGVLRELMGGDVAMINCGVGGTGYSTAAGTSDFITRVGDVVNSNPDIVFVQGEQNDGAVSASTLQAQASTVLASLTSQLPKALIFVVGSYSATTPTQLKMQHDAALRAAANASPRTYFISWVDPSGLTQLGTVTNWVTGTYYTMGDAVLDPSTGAPWIKHLAASTAGATWNTTEQASFKPASIIYGTGRIGATAGNGNADVMINSADAIHPSARGSIALGRSVFRQMYETLRTLSVQSPVD